jgi:hypothetical protein
MPREEEVKEVYRLWGLYLHKSYMGLTAICMRRHVHYYQESTRTI